MGGIGTVYYFVRKIGDNYYLYKGWYDKRTGEKKQKSIGNCVALEELADEHLKSGRIRRKRARRLAWLGRRPYKANPSVGDDAQFYTPTQGISDPELVVKFLEWCTEQGNSQRTCRDRANYVKKPLDPNNDHSVKAWRLFFKFMGWDTTTLPKVKQSGVDFKVPSDREIIESVSIACGHSITYCVVYKVLVESGARLNEVVSMVSNYDPSKDKEQEGFFTYLMGKAENTKRSFYIFHITKVRPARISESHASKLARKLDIVRPKYVRKWVATKMAALGIPSEVIDYIQGRTPRQILTQHYLNLYALALQHYPKYVAYLREVGLVER